MNAKRDCCLLWSRSIFTKSQHPALTIGKFATVSGSRLRFVSLGRYSVGSVQTRGGKHVLRKSYLFNHKIGIISRSLHRRVELPQMYAHKCKSLQWESSYQPRATSFSVLTITTIKRRCSNSQQRTYPAKVHSGFECFATNEWGLLMQNSRKYLLGTQNVIDGAQFDGQGTSSSSKSRFSE